MPNLPRRILGCAFVSVASLLPGIAHASSPRDLPSEDKPSPPVNPAAGESEILSFHFQLTEATQYHPGFGQKFVPDPNKSNSLDNSADSASAFVSTLYGDLRLWPGGELLVNPEMSGGAGLSATHGVAAFPSGIVYRVGDPAPSIYLARVAVSQSFGLGGGRVINEAAPNELAGTRDRDQFAITVGFLSVTDVFDGNRYASDATTRFFDWALFASGAWDYAANTRGYTGGVLSDLTMGAWSVRAGVALEPEKANGPTMDLHVDKAHSLMVEYELRYHLGKLPGAWSLLLFHNTARMGSYEAVVEDTAHGSLRYQNDITKDDADGRTKYGFALSMEQQLAHGLGSFVRLSWNDGHNESWAFTEIDQSLAFGVVQDGELWHRDHDEAGAALVIDGISPWHRQYLEGGGLGFIIGDGAAGKLNYAPEVEGDTYYKLHLTDAIALSGIYQPILNPAYNHDRGPLVHVLSARLHVAF